MAALMALPLHSVEASLLIEPCADTRRLVLAYFPSTCPFRCFFSCCGLLVSVYLRIPARPRALVLPLILPSLSALVCR